MSAALSNVGSDQCYCRSTAFPLWDGFQATVSSSGKNTTLSASFGRAALGAVVLHLGR
jgi:hypothetical protein